jgi:hypothetical protein
LCLTSFLFAALFLIKSGCGTNDGTKEELEARLQRLEASAPGVGTVMSGVQMHFAKLYFAGQAHNGPLAEFELYEVEENLDKAAALRPEEQGTNLVGLTDAFKKTQLVALRSAVHDDDWSAFQSSYTEAIGVCNGCHQETGHSYIVITTPTAPPVSNQQWEPVNQPSENGG